MTVKVCEQYRLFPDGCISQEECLKLLYRLIETVNWHEDFYVAFNRKFNIPRLQAWFADAGIQYSYVNNLLSTQPWLDPLRAIKNEVEAVTGSVFNSLLVTYYRDGNDYVDWHADDEEELGENPVIASLSLGTVRRFQLRHNTRAEESEIPLKNGDLLLMQPGLQKYWQHRVPKESNLNQPRINLTFRQVVNIP